MSIPNPADPIANFVAQSGVQLQPGDGVVLYTPSILKAQNLVGEAYGVERLGRVVSRHWAKPAEAIKQAIIEDVHRHIGQQKMQSDLTLVELKPK